MTHVKIWIHVVWSTKERYPYLHTKLREKVIDHIKENALKKEIYIDTINGYTDHLHCLLCLSPTKSLATTIQYIKGESSFWINRERLTEIKFEWTGRYYAASVSESHLDNVRRYIHNQEKHHQNTSFEEEHNKLFGED